ncbi:hypothetical protein P872_21895 [Rhodonellum psychrophilum GCM71 = DSM 17998]|uniref:Uncharacterized protein n=2 Tax=Rhodonellum TaxID=336827 RepID=U5BJ44_9BACT|nr:MULTISPECIES: DUF6140 family protein [Rhodonellum]ERM80435.1 hypothetical protein P872_21895 [Rhodonellum psychrophilum GCM71 = DSM 17998]
MALFKITVKNPMFRNGIRLEKGMSVQVVMISAAHYPLHYKNGEAIVDAFQRIWAVDLRKANAVNSAILEVVEIK